MKKKMMAGLLAAVLLAGCVTAARSADRTRSPPTPR